MDPVEFGVADVGPERMTLRNGGQVDEGNRQPEKFCFRFFDSAGLGFLSTLKMRLTANLNYLILVCCIEKDCQTTKNKIH